MRRLSTLFVVASALWSSALAAQQPAPVNQAPSFPAAGQPGAAAPAPRGIVVKALEMPAEQFQILLLPRTKAELQSDAAKWQQSLQEKATEIARLRVISQRTQDAGAKASVVQLADQQDQIADRMRLVLDALEAKGGDVEEHRAYLSSVTAANVLENPAVLSTQVIKWLKSPEGGVKLGYQVLLFLGTLLIARLLAGLTASLVQRTLSMSKVKVSELLTSFFVHTSRNAVMMLGVIVGLSFLGVPVGPFLAAMGAVGFIVGFALQDTLGNFASGVMILFYRPYDLEDVVEVSGVTGKVKAMTLVSTTLLKPDNQLVVVPNKSIWGGIITNITGNATRRVDMTFGIGYGDDVRHAQEVLERLVASHPLVLETPEPVIRVHELADSSVNFVCRPWVKTADYWSVYWDLTRMVKETFDSEGISIPFPQQDVHMHPVPPQESDRAAA